MSPAEAQRGNAPVCSAVSKSMTTATLPIHGIPTPRLRAVRMLKNTLLLFALLAGIGAITVAATANAMTEQEGGMAGYA